MTVEKEGDYWRIKGKGAERATLAYAVNIDGRIVYKLNSTSESMARASGTR